MSDKSECIKVVIRLRPMAPNETAAGFQKVVQMFSNKGEVVVKREGGEDPPKVFTFDAVFNELVM